MTNGSKPALPLITVAPNGARLQKSDHPNVPISADELAQTASACQAAGAGQIHLHVRDPQGRHSLDVGTYRAAMTAVSKAAPDLSIQVTTEAAGRYDVPAQLHLLDTLRPAAASIAQREIARAPDMAAKVYATAHAHGTRVQHILYGNDCLERLIGWFDADIVPRTMSDAILVLGQYTPPCAGLPRDLSPALERAQAAGLAMTVCAFGQNEQACLLAAAAKGCAVRVGFENNMRSPDGAFWPSNADAVAGLKAACAAALEDDL